MQKQIKSVLDSAFAEFAGDSAEIILNVPKDSNLGHFTTPLAFSLAKSLKKSPNEIAKDLAQKLQNLPEFSRNFSKVEAVNGYVNLFLSDEFLAEFSRVVLKKGDLRGESNSNKISVNPSDSSESQRILLEFVSANPTGPLHIGHARGAIWGDTLARIGRFLGHKIITEYYINDAGSQIENLVNSVLNALNVPLDSQNLDAESTQNLYKGAYIVDLADSAKKHFGAQNLTKTQDLRDFCVNQMLDLIKANLQSANISFDNFVSEKSLMPKLDSTLTQLKSNGALYEEGGKIWLKSTQYGDEKDRVIVRESGEPTYLAGDIVYHNDKFSRDFDRYINIWGADHHGYIARIKASVAFLGYDSSKLEVLLSQMVSLLQDGAPYKMSKRAGTFILMSEIIDEIGIDALRFVFLTKRADTHLEFDITSLKAQDSSNPIFYINYANARIHTLLGKRDSSDSSESAKDLSESSDFDFANLEREWVDLLFFALLLPRILEVAFDERAMQKLPEYLKNLASKLHFCYNSFKIIGSPNEGVICNILKVVSLSITTGLGLMGITAKTKM
ncbi:arginine--tRNA ligase [Helicobacter sp. 23-1044]